MKVYTVANDEKNKGYTATVQALAVLGDDTYQKETQHLKSTEDGNGFDNQQLTTFVDNVSKTVDNGEEVCVLFAGGNGWNQRINTIQSQLKDKNVKYILATDRINENENFNGIENLEVIIQTTPETINAAIGTGKNITTHTVDIYACANYKNMQSSAEIFRKENINKYAELEEIVKNTPCLFYLGGRGEGFPDNTIQDFNTFADSAMDQLNELSSNSTRSPKNNLVIFTHGLRSFTHAEGNQNDFEPIETMYKHIQDNLQKEQTAYIFSQNLTKDGKRTSVLKKITKNGIQDIEIKGNPYSWSLFQAKENGQYVSATEEQQNFPIETLLVGIEKNKINGIKWNLQADNHHELYDNVSKKDNLKTSAKEFTTILSQNKQKTQKKQQDIVIANMSSLPNIDNSKNTSRSI